MILNHKTIITAKLFPKNQIELSLYAICWIKLVIKLIKQFNSPSKILIISPRTEFPPWLPSVSLIRNSVTTKSEIPRSSSSSISGDPSAAGVARGSDYEAISLLKRKLPLHHQTQGSSISPSRPKKKKKRDGSNCVEPGSVLLIFKSRVKYNYYL